MHRSLSFRSALLPLLLSASAACSPAPLPAPVSQADAVSGSKSAATSKEYAPQAFAEAEKLLAEAKYLHDSGRNDEAEAAGLQALAAYEQAFALARLGRAQERIEVSEQELVAAQQQVQQLDQLQAQISADADAYEMRARVHLDQEAVKDVEGMTADRAAARRTAAKQLTAEATLLCAATKMLDEKAEGLQSTQGEVGQLAKELNQGSIKDDLFPRAATLRANCLQHLTLARRPLTQAAPESAASDELLSGLSSAGNLMVYRDDRGIAVNLGQPLDAKGEPSEHAKQAMSKLSAAAKAHPHFPLLIVIHTAKADQSKRAQALRDFAEAALKQGGVEKFSVENVENAQPVVFPSLRGADEKNERIEVIFVNPGR